MSVSVFLAVFSAAALAAAPVESPIFSAVEISETEQWGTREFSAKGGEGGMLESFTVSQAAPKAAAAARSAVVILAIVDGPPAFAMPVRLNPPAVVGETNSWDLMPRLIEGAKKGEFSLKPVPGGRIQVQLLAAGGEFAGPPLSATWAYPGMLLPEKKPGKTVTRVRRVVGQETGSEPAVEAEENPESPEDAE